MTRRCLTCDSRLRVVYVPDRGPATKHLDKTDCPYAHVLMPLPRLQVGQVVAWTSQSVGSPRRKRGTVIEVVPAGVRPNIRGAGMRRDHESYVVSACYDDATQIGGRLRKYWPRVHQLEIVTDTKQHNMVP